MRLSEQILLSPYLNFCTVILAGFWHGRRICYQGPWSQTHILWSVLRQGKSQEEQQVLFCNNIYFGNIFLKMCKNNDMAFNITFWQKTMKFSIGFQAVHRYFVLILLLLFVSAGRISNLGGLPRWSKQKTSLLILAILWGKKLIEIFLERAQRMAKIPDFTRNWK